MKGDCRDIEKIGFAMRGMDAVIHLAAIVGDPACALDEKITREINIASTRMIGELAKGFGVRRLIFASTCSVYGACDNLIDERSSLNPVSLYAHTKIDSEKVLLELATADFSPVILRLATVYGLSYRPRFDLVVNLLIAKALTEKKISIFGGEQWRPFIHVDDVAESFCKCLGAKVLQVHGQIFNVGSNEQNYKIKQVGEMINQRWPDTVVEIMKDLDDKRNYRVRFDKIQEILGFIPLKTIKDAFTEFEVLFSSNNITNYQDQLYSNHKYLSSTDNIGLLRYDNSIFNNPTMLKPA
jgi:nucleoside-diphosphate-sugar epimerase